MKQFMTFLFLSLFPGLYSELGETICGKSCLYLARNIYNVRNEVEVFMNNTVAGVVQQQMQDIFLNIQDNRQITKAEHLEENEVKSECKSTENLLCATFLLRNYTTSYFGWSVEQINICGPSDENKCDDIIERERKLGIVIDECFNYSCTKDRCTAKFIVRKSFTNSQYILGSATFLIFIMAVVLKKRGNLDVYEY